MGVLGIGGVFFRAADPDALNAWYKEHLDIGSGCAAEAMGDPVEWSWLAQGGPTVFAPFKADTDYFPADKSVMLNFRVNELDALLDKLRAAGIEVTTKPEWDSAEAGRFARIYDPENNAIELWEMPTP